MKEFTAHEFHRALLDDSLSETAPTVVVGMVKPNGEDAIAFAPGRSCKSWADIPLEMIERVEHLGKVPCLDHEHDFVRLHLAPPTTPEGKLFASLLSAAPQERAAPNPPRSAKRQTFDGEIVSRPSRRAVSRREDCGYYCCDLWVHCVDGGYYDIPGYGTSAEAAFFDAVAQIQNYCGPNGADPPSRSDLSCNCCD